jgi:hypothetical protein
MKPKIRLSGLRTTVVKKSACQEALGAIFLSRGILGYHRFVRQPNISRAGPTPQRANAHTFELTASHSKMNASAKTKLPNKVMIERLIAQAPAHATPDPDNPEWTPEMFRRAHLTRNRAEFDAWRKKRRESAVAARRPLPSNDE